MSRNVFPPAEVRRALAVLVSSMELCRQMQGDRGGLLLVADLTDREAEIIKGSLLACVQALKDGAR